MKDIKVGVYLLTANPLVRKGRIATYLHATVQPTAPKPTPNTESDDIAGTRGETYWQRQVRRGPSAFIAQPEAKIMAKQTRHL